MISNSIQNIPFIIVCGLESHEVCRGCVVRDTDIQLISQLHVLSHTCTVRSVTPRTCSVARVSGYSAQNSAQSEMHLHVVLGGNLAGLGMRNSLEFQLRLRHLSDRNRSQYFFPPGDTGPPKWRLHRIFTNTPPDFRLQNAKTKL